MIKKIAMASMLVLSSSSLYAQSAVDGFWNFAMNSPMGSVSATVQLVSDGSNLMGEFDLGGGRKWPIEDGQVNGNAISFNINRDGASMTYAMKANIEGDTASGTAEAMGTIVEWSMTRDE